MKLLTSGMLILLAGVTLLTAAPAMARVDIDINVGVPGAYVTTAPYGAPPRYLGPPAYVRPGPVYVQPGPAYVQPGAVYVQPGPIYVQPGPAYVQPGPVYVQPRPIYREHWRERDWRHGHGHGHGGRHWDRDGDGVPNRHDRRPHNPYRY